ncbi:MAG: RidA family protein [Gammaproteobacteria bacterium]|nr:RidA family protein [Gammaproteobacteria bacterium]
MKKEVITTKDAPDAIGTYSQAIKCDRTVYLSGQIPLAPGTGQMISGDFEAQTRQVFANLGAVAKAAGGDLNSAVKFNVYLTDLNNFTIVNRVMEECLRAPYPARAAVQVAALPKDAAVEVDAVLVI